MSTVRHTGTKGEGEGQYLIYRPTNEQMQTKSQKKRSLNFVGFFPLPYQTKREAARNFLGSTTRLLIFFWGCKFCSVFCGLFNYGWNIFVLFHEPSCPLVNNIIDINIIKLKVEVGVRGKGGYINRKHNLLCGRANNSGIL